MANLDYKAAGVDRDAADRLVTRIVGLSKKTLNKRVKSAVGGYASLYALDSKRWLAASTDGVGTKLKLAFELNEHRTVGIDLVAMSVNDLICVGAEPLFFLDYFATGKLDPAVAERVLEGIVEGCQQAGCALVGGETAEMPDFYSPGEYDLGGFAVGFVQSWKVLPKKKIKKGLALIGVASNGTHSNGYSLLRKLLPEAGPERKERARELLTPTRIYVKSVAPLLEKGWLEGLAHITGSGFLNVPRISDRVSYRIALPPRGELAPVYAWVAEQSRLDFKELAQTFNLGLGLILAVEPKRVDAVLKSLRKNGERAWPVGETVALKKGDVSEVEVTQDGERAFLRYE